MLTAPQNLTLDRDPTLDIPPFPRRFGGAAMRRAAARAVRGAALALGALAGLLALPAQAGLAGPTFVTPADMAAGSLLLRSTEPDRYIAAPRLGTDVDITVSGPTARARVTQLFHNPTDTFVEAVYVFPLPETSAVDSLKMVIGDRIVVGDIKERQKAREIFEQAKAAGQKASLLEQERPNIFTNTVANIGPGETVLVQIEYQETVKQTAGTFSLRVPLVVAPRYHPKPMVQSVDFNPNGRGFGPASDPVPDRDRLSPPVLDPREHAAINPVSIAVRLQAGFPLATVKSHHHAVTMTGEGDTRLVRLAAGMVPADRDFELTWTAEAAKTPTVGLFRERIGGADYVLAFVTPPPLPQSDTPRPREIVFVIDNSGSMGGISIVQAKASLLQALGRLRPIDRFNVIRFDHTMDVLFADTVAADGENLQRAKAFVSALEARGGTEMVPAMQAALRDARAGERDILRQVVFLTDGAIGNELQLFDTITQSLGRSRVFMVGIGTAPNTFLMNRAAELGRGTFTHIGSVEQVEERMLALFQKLESPAVTSLSVQLAEADITPQMLPDLYRGQPLVLAARVEHLAGTFDIQGRIGDQPWRVSLPLAKAAEGQGLSKIWARRKIDDAQVARTLRRITPEDADQRILTLALEHHLVARLTSLVAVDQTPSRPPGQKLVRTDMPLNLPAGWDFDAVFGEKPQRRASGAALVPVAYIAATPAPAAQAPGAAHAKAATQGVTLPQTATDATLRLWAGALLIVVGLMFLAFRRRPRLA